MISANAVKVSICVPAYKDVYGMKRLFDSIRRQDYTDIEIIVCDDTPDNSVELICDEYTDLPIRYFHNDKPLGACGNWNRTLDEATGDYIKIMHQDDAFTFDNSLSTFVKMLDDNPNAILGFSGSRQVTIHKDKPLDMSDYFDRCIEDENLSNMQKDYRDLYRGDWIGAPSATIFKKCEVRFDPNLTWIIDIDFYIGILSHNPVFVASKDPLISIGVSDEQLTNRCIDDGELNIREYSHVMRKYELAEYPEYRKKICEIAVLYNQKYNTISHLGIPKEEFIIERKKRNKYLRDFYKDLIIKKLTGKA